MVPVKDPLSRRTAGVAKSIASSKERNLTVENLSVDVVAIYFSISNELLRGATSLPLAIQTLAAAVASETVIRRKCAHRSIVVSRNYRHPFRQGLGAEPALSTSCRSFKSRNFASRHRYRYRCTDLFATITSMRCGGIAANTANQWVGA